MVAATADPTVVLHIDEPLELLAPLIGIEARSYAVDETQQWPARQLGAEFVELGQCGHTHRRRLQLRCEKMAEMHGKDLKRRDRKRGM